MTYQQVITTGLSFLRSALDFRLFDLGDSRVTISTLLIVVGVVMLSFRVSSVFQRQLTKNLEERGVANEGAVAVGGRLAHYLIVLIGLGVGLQTAGVDLSALFAAGAVFAIAIGFAVQNVAQNFVSGVIILVEGAIKPGDVLEVGGRIVRVKQMGIRSTVVLTMDNTELILPNSDLVASSVYNLTMSDRVVRIRVGVGVAYESDLEQVHGILKQVGEHFNERSQARNPVVLLKDFGTSSVDFELSIWTEEPWQIPILASKLRLAIWNAFKESGVVIAFPQIDVHLDEEVVTRIGKGAA